VLVAALLYLGYSIAAGLIVSGVAAMIGPGWSQRSCRPS